MRLSPRTSLALLLATGLLASCGGESRGPDPNVGGLDIPGDPGSGLGNYGNLTGEGSLLSFGNKKPNQGDQGGGPGTLGVNAYLWRGALDTLSFMPLASADPFSGVIITDWYSPPAANGERFKATAYVMGRELRSDGIRVAIFRQVLQNGQWVDAGVSPVTVGEIENKVLARARQLREQSQSSS